MKTQNKILLIINPISGNRKKDQLIDYVKDYVESKGSGFYLYKTDGENDVERIKKILDQERPSRVLVAGGDGTVKIVAEIIEDPNIILGILPQGSANGLATNLGIGGDLEEFVSIAMGNDFLQIDTLLINDHLSLHIADLGLNAALIKNYEGSTLRGKLGYFLNTIPTLVTEDYPYTFRIEANGESTEVSGILLAIANANSFGTGANINPTGKMNDGKFEILVFKKLDFVEIIKTLNSELEVDPSFVHTICTQNAVIHCEKEIDFQIDGEYLGTPKTVTAVINQKKINIAVPAKTLEEYKMHVEA